MKLRPGHGLEDVHSTQACQLPYAPAMDIAPLYKPIPFLDPVTGHLAHDPPILLRDEQRQTYVPYSRRDLGLAIAGSDRKRPGVIFVALQKAWKTERPGEDPTHMSMPAWLVAVWREFCGEKFMGLSIVANDTDDRVYLTRLSS